MNKIDYLVEAISMNEDWIKKEIQAWKQWRTGADPAQEKAFEMFKAKMPVTTLPAARKGYYRLPAACAVERVGNIPQLKNELASSFAGWLKANPVASAELEALAKRIPLKRGVDGVERQEFDSPEYKAWGARRSELLNEAGLAGLNQEILAWSILSEKSIKKMIDVMGYRVSCDGIPKGWTEEEVTFLVFALLQPEDYLTVMEYYGKEGAHAFEEGEVTEKIRDQWRATERDQKGTFWQEGGDGGAWKLEDLSLSEKVNYELALPLARLQTAIGGGELIKVADLVDSQGNYFNPGMPFDLKDGVDQLRLEVQKGTLYAWKSYVNGKVVDTKSVPLTMSTIIGACYRAAVVLCGFSEDEFAELYGLKFSEMAHFKETYTNSAEKAKRVSDSIQGEGKLLEFGGQYRCLGSFCRIPAGILDDYGITYHTIEEYFQAAKFAEPANRAAISESGPLTASKEGKNLKPAGFDEVNVLVEAFKKRAAVDQVFKAVLLDTAKRKLFIKNCFGKECQGDLNRYGEALMVVGKELLAEQ